MTILDAGDPYDIHPLDKRTVGHRLAAAALSETYGLPTPFAGPELEDAVAEGSAIRLRFDAKAGDVLTSDGDVIRGFTIAGSGQVFLPATGRLVSPNAILVTNPEVPEPVAVRYAWAGAPSANLIGANRIPVAPFRTDDWPRPTEGVI